jgi:hypothetical protein
MPDDPSPLLAAIDAALVSFDYIPERTAPNGRALHLRGRAADYWLILWADEATQWLACRCVFPTRVPEARRVAVAEAVARLNQPRPLGNFDVDFETGEIQFRAGADVEGADLGDAFVRNLIAMVVSSAEQHHDALMAVAFGGAQPADVVPPSLAAAGFHTADAVSDVAEASLERPDPDGPIAPDAARQIERLLAGVPRTAPAGAAPAGRTEGTERVGDTTATVPEPAPGADATPTTVDRAPLPNSYVVPGTRLVAGEYPGLPPARPAGEVRARVDALLDAGVRTVVDLTDPADGLAPYADVLAGRAAERGLRVAHERLTIRDMDVCDAAHMRRVLDAVDAGLRRGAVYVHCWGGVGRTGTAVGCWLVRHGRTGDEALAEVGASSRR